MGIELNSTLNAFVNWANSAPIGNDSLVHATAMPSEGGMQVRMSDNRNDGIGFFARLRRNAYTKDMNNATRALFKNAVMELFNAKTINDVPKSVRDQMKLGDYNKGRPLSARRIIAVVNAAKIALLPNPYKVSGNGPAVAAVKGFVNSKLATYTGTKPEKVAALKADIDRVAKNRFNMFFATDMKELQSGETSTFEKDHVRLMYVPKFNVGNETLTFDSKTPFEDKKDIIAKFVKKDMNANFADLTGADRNKAFVVMVFLGQRFGITMLDGVQRSLARNLDDPPLQFGQFMRSADVSTLEFSFDSEGSLKVHYEDVKDNPQIVGKVCYANHDKGSSVTVTTDAKIDVNELETICNTDYVKYDDTKVENLMKENEGKPDCDEKGAASLGEYRFGPGATFDVSFNAVFIGGEED